MYARCGGCEEMEGYSRELGLVDLSEGGPTLFVEGVAVVAGRLDDTLWELCDGLLRGTGGGLVRV